MLFQSFNLKPTVATRPSIQGPQTNLRVAAILEKAKTIRQVSLSTSLCLSLYARLCVWARGCKGINMNQVSLCISLVLRFSILQAFAGSDEEDDEDSWSDS